MSLTPKIGGGQQKPLRHNNNPSPHTKHKHKHPINQHTPTKTKSTGFTMVELIITVVILAIIIAVTIGGLSTYIKKSRINTDINNASTIKKALSTLQIDRDIINSFDSLNSSNKIGIQWQDAQKIQDGHLTSEGNNAIVDENIPPLFINKIGEILPEGLPASKVEKPFYITISKNDNNEIIIDSFNEIEIDGSLSSEEGTGESGAGSNSNRLPTIVESHDHTYQTTITLEETCTTPGEKTYSCTKCDKVYTEEIPASHSYSTEFTVDTEPTCIATGTKSYHCTREGCTAKADITTIAMKAHTYGDWKTTVTETCTTDGTKERACTVCNTKDTATIPSLGHKSVNGGTASIHTKCSVCQATLSTTHSYTKTTQTVATCTTKGTSKYTCSCGYSYTSQDIPAKGHTYVNNTCTGCGDKQYAELTLGSTYSFGGYEWVMVERPNSNYCVLQSLGVTKGAWPGYTMSKFGNGNPYVGDISNLDISSYDSKMQNLYNQIKSLEYTSASKGKGLYLTDGHDLNYDDNGYARGIHSDALVKVVSVTNGYAWSNEGFFMDTGNNPYVYINGYFADYYDSSHRTCSDAMPGHTGNYQNYRRIVAPCFNLDLSKVKLSGSTITVK